MDQMKFRQRVSWLLVVLYLAATAGLVYYIFEISDSFNQFALDHVSKYNGNHSGWHMADIPMPVILLFVIIPYMQVFYLLLSCTKPDPRMYLISLWPVRLYAAFVRLCKKYTNAKSDEEKPINCPVPNGHSLIDT